MCVDEKLEFVYKIKYEEGYETFYSLSMKFGKRMRNLLILVMTVIAAVMLFLYYRDSRKIHYFFIAVLDILLLYGLIYMPALKARKGAKKVSRQNGTYKIELTGDGMIRAGGQCIPLKGDKDARMIETETIFAIRPDRVHTFCLPKRILTDQQTEKVRKLLQDKMR